MANINIKLRVWRQKSVDESGAFKDYQANDISTDSSFLEMLDVVNEELEKKGEEPIAFDHDCREGICGMCGATINGKPHGPDRGTTLCQTHMRSFENGDTIVLEPFRARAFPVVRDLVVDRSAFDRIQQKGGYVSMRTGSAQDANAIPIDKKDAEKAMDAAACIGCGACVAACPNAAAMLFTAAKISQFALLPQGQAERESRVLNMVAQMDEENFGNCSNEYLCEEHCPKEISIANIARMNRDYLKASLTKEQ